MLMISGLYDALKDAGASEALAQKAAAEVAHYESTLAEMKSDIRLIKWIVSFVLALTVGVLLQLTAL
jgi:hypothetical protein